MDQNTSDANKTHSRNKNAIFLGLVAVAAIAAGALVYFQASKPDPQETPTPQAGN
jgi:hypothetical protein